MPTFRVRIHCVCGHDFEAVIRPRGDDPPDKRYEVICPMNASRYVVRRSDLKCEVADAPPGAVEAHDWQPQPTAEPWHRRPPYPALLFAGVLLVLGLFALAGLALLNGW